MHRSQHVKTGRSFWEEDSIGKSTESWAQTRLGTAGNQTWVVTAGTGRWLGMAGSQVWWGRAEAENAGQGMARRILNDVTGEVARVHTIHSFSHSFIQWVSTDHHDSRLCVGL
jgi:hypothetical protein